MCPFFACLRTVLSLHPPLVKRNQRLATRLAPHCPSSLHPPCKVIPKCRIDGTRSQRETTVLHRYDHIPQVDSEQRLKRLRNRLSVSGRRIRKMIINYVKHESIPNFIQAESKTVLFRRMKHPLLKMFAVWTVRIRRTENTPITRLGKRSTVLPAIDHQRVGHPGNASRHIGQPPHLFQHFSMTFRRLGSKYLHLAQIIDFDDLLFKKLV